jgi:hypothetical protein
MTTIGALEPTLGVHQAGSALEGMPTARACVACQHREER